ncbi:General transcription factor 3C polypeptide 5 [Nosema granulosis]|uniref:General transcription factor 3C polypeptide 5 n=1 Tax=Nosema granulosis TaxID=83296 RepID=A0A9P6KYI9_9MICR|nr:General transcription factor 3C polypeptide 5 [Nosema granulosis]
MEYSKSFSTTTEENKSALDNFDIIDYPLKIHNSKMPMFFKVDSLRYEFRILDTIDSKRIHAHKKKKNSTLFIHLRIEDSLCKILGYSTNLFEFQNTCDFYLEQTQPTQTFNTLTSNILSGSLNDILSTGLEFKEMLENNTIPEYIPLNINIKGALKDSIDLRDAPMVLPEYAFYKISYEAEIPTKCNEEYLSIVKKYIQDEMELIEKFFASLKDPIMRISFITRHLEEFNKNNNVCLLLEKMKKALPLFRYYFLDGPWRKSWILYGFDPRQDRANYKYQIIDLRSDGVFFTLIEKENIIKEVEDHKDWYLKEECDKKHGFLKKTLEQLILYHNYVDFSSSENEDLDFEVFDV